MEKVGKVNDIKDKSCIKIKGKELALFKIKDKFYCIDNLCTHANGPLCEGNLNGLTITCPWHGSKFDIKTGKVKAPPAMKDVKSYKVTVKEDYLWIDL